MNHSGNNPHNRACASRATLRTASAATRDLPSAGHRAASDMSPYSVSPAEFRRLQLLIYRQSGIWLSEGKSALLTGRLSKRLRSLGLANFSQYFRRVSNDDEELRTMLDAITTNETQFFREPVHFDFLERHVIPRWQADAAAGRRSRTVRVWSAGCSTGQEAYSVAMLLAHRLPSTEGWSVEILATDLSRRVLAIAEAGVWDASKCKEIPPDYVRAFMLKGLGENRGKIKAAPSIRFVRFMRLNLSDVPYPAIGKFDLVFCRNVLIYFDADSRKRVIGQLLRHLAPRGHLFVGHAESLNSVCASLQCVIPTVYFLAGDAEESPTSRRS